MALLRTINQCDDCGSRWLAPLGETLDSRCSRCGSHATVVVARSWSAEAVDQVVFWGGLTCIGVVVVVFAVPLLLAMAIGVSQTGGEAVGDVLGEALERRHKRRTPLA